MFNNKLGQTLSEGNDSALVTTDESITSESQLLSDLQALPILSFLSNGKPLAPSPASSPASSGSGVISLLEQINEQCDERVSNVNFGGCAYYAALLQWRFRELGWPSKPAVISYNPGNGAAHVFTTLEIGGKTYFHDGIRTMEQGRWEYELGSDWDYLEDEIIEVVEQNRWNMTFSPTEEVPILCEIIEEVLGPFNERPHFNNMLQGVHI